jgi:putative membrane protein
MKIFLMLGASALLLAGCGESGDTSAPPADSATDTAATDTAVAPTAPPQAATPATPTDAPTYIAKAGAGDMWEIESSKALLAKSGNAEVKKFAQMMIDQHGQSTAKIKAAATAAKIEVPAPKLDPDQQRMLDEIKQADAAGIDAVYLRHQRAAHDAALALHKAYGEGGDTESLKKAANEIVPVVETHRSHLGKLGTQP